MLSGDFAFMHPCGLWIARSLGEKDAAAYLRSNPQREGNGFTMHFLPLGTVEQGVLTANLCFYLGALVAVSLRVSAEMAGHLQDSSCAVEERECVRLTGKWLRGMGYKPGHYRWCEILLGYDSFHVSGSATVRFHQ